MAKSKIVLALIATAQALAETIKNENLIIATNKLDELEDATHSSKEYKDLKEIVDELQNNTGDDKSDNTENEDDLKSNIENKKDELQNNTGDDKSDNTENEDDLKSNIENKKDELQNNTGDDKSDNTENEDDLKSNIENKKDELQNNTGDDFAIEKPKKLNYTGVKMVGDKWYSIKDNYRKSFATADECAKHFN